VVLPVAFKDKEVQSHGEPCCSRGSLLEQNFLEKMTLGWP